MKEKHKKEKRPLIEALNEILDIPPDVIPSSTLIEIRAESSVSVVGARKILLYTPQKIRLSTKKSVVSVVGERLICTSYHPDGVKIDGHILSVSFGEAKDESL